MRNESDREEWPARRVRIVEKLRRARARAADRNATFASNADLLPPVPVDAVRAFEQRCGGISLPVDYVRYITEISSGGVGPCYGLTPFQHHCDTYAANGGASDRLRRPFPYTKAMFAMTAADFDDESDEAAKDANGAAVEPRLEDENGSNSPVPPPSMVASDKEVSHWDGTIHLCEEGCGYYDFLVVSGAERGHVWGDFNAADCGIRPLPDDAGAGNMGRRWTFLDWFEHWLDRALH